MIRLQFQRLPIFREPPKQKLSELLLEARLTVLKQPKKATVNTTADTTVAVTEIDTVLVVNKNSKKIHSSTCSYAKNMKEENKAVISSDELQDYLDKGYTVCTRCKCYKR